MQSAALVAMGLASRGLKTEASSQHSRLAVLDFAPPAALLEIGFLDRQANREEMLSREVRIAFAEAMLPKVLAWRTR